MLLDKTFSILVFAILISIVSTASATTVYRWVDEDGHVHFGSRAENEKAKEIKIKIINKGSGVSENIVNKQKRFLKALEQENKSIAEEKKKKREQEELKLTRCNASRDQLKRAESASALYDLDEKGNRVLLNKKQYEQAMAQARARVEKWCN